MASRLPHKSISRRTLLVGGGAGAGLLIAWGLWPRRYEPNLRTGPGETLFNAFLKIGQDGRVIVAVPQAEVGQGVYTTLPQILADELGADWRTVGVEPAPIHPLYANDFFAEERSGSSALGRWAAREQATRSALMITAGSTSVRAFEPRLREAGAAARALLAKAAARRWDTDWETLDTADGFVVNGADKLSFGELAEAAADEEVPDILPMRGGVDHRLAGQSLARLDLPSKVDGTAQFAGDVRLPGMLFASVRRGPIGGGEVIRFDRAAAQRVSGVVAVFEEGAWVGAAANNWWAANQAVEAMRPAFRSPAASVSDASIDRALRSALESGSATRVVNVGDADTEVQGDSTLRATYSAAPAPNAPMETLTATARFTGDRLEVWAPTQAPGFARAAAARAGDVGEEQVTIYPMLVGSGYGRKLETDAIEQAVVIAKRLKRPVQLTWSRIEETLQDSFRPPVLAGLAAAVAEGGRITAWQARIAAPSAAAQTMARLQGSTGGAEDADAAAVDGAAPPYAIPAVAVHHIAADAGLRTGLWRSGAHSYTAFFTECFIDEIARAASVEPLSFRMQMLGENPRLARCLTTATTLGGWDGGASGSNMGLAAHSAFGSHIATLVEAEVTGDQRIRVTRAVAAVDCGRMINPDIVRQQIEGGILHGIAGATGRRIRFEGGIPQASNFNGLGLPVLTDSPEITVELLDSDEAPGGVTELGVPSVAPAIANAIFASTGQRLRSLPLVPGNI